MPRIDECGRAPCGAPNPAARSLFASLKSAFLLAAILMAATPRLVLRLPAMLPVGCACFAFNVLLGWRMRSRRSPFLVADAGQGAPWRIRTLAGLAARYAAAIPFLRSPLIGDGGDSAALFSGPARRERLVPAPDERSLDGFAAAAI